MSCNVGFTGSVHSRQEHLKPNKFLPGRTAFEVVSAKTMKDGYKKFVLYSIAVQRTIGSDTSQAIIERRYSEFHELNKDLRRRFPHIMDSVIFPKKAVTGNYKHQFIAERSRAFEHFLTQIFQHEDIRTSAEFQEFFYNQDLRRAYNYMLKRNFEEALPFLQNALHLQEKMIGERHQDTIRTLCAIIVVYLSRLESQPHVLGYAEKALSDIGDDQTNPFLIPLLQTLIGVRWRLHKDKRDLEARLAQYVKPGLPTCDMPTLEELIMQSLSHL
ncbi:sorting nexin-21-like isoform X2 [Diadema antillarum]|uniref:sorting nexin-21-like isoform X2 n=1 Tax=Diadema antillarum TaxID=105358 RepID=UPI003A8836BB